MAWEKGALEKVEALNDKALSAFIEEYIALCKPSSVYVCDDSDEDMAYIRKMAVENAEEKPLKIKGHTAHFDGINDQGRDKKATKYLVEREGELGPQLNSILKAEGLKEIKGLLAGAMQGKKMYVLFFCLGPRDSAFSIPAVQITDSAYVAHSEYMLYRRGYNVYKMKAKERGAFRFVHSAGELDERGNSKNVDKRRIYIDLNEKQVYSVNTQYAGNTVGLKKLALRLAIKKASEEGGWLAEHMFLMGVNSLDGKRRTYIAGAFPSACGKTSTAMLRGENIIGDDIAYIIKKDGKAFGANVECGIFGIIKDVNEKDDPMIWNVLNREGEVIFSNILIDKDKMPRWLGDGRPEPESGESWCGRWVRGMKDKSGNEVPYAHKNARYTIRLYALDNLDENLDNPEGVHIRGIIYGGRDSRAWPPVMESFNWGHGVVAYGASLESETTAATLGKEGQLAFNPMSNIDFVALPLGAYVKAHLDFKNGLDDPPRIFAVNYFQRDEKGAFLTDIHDKRVWIKWIERRINDEVAALKTPLGNIPVYEDLKAMFKKILDKDYTEEAYSKQFTIDVDANIAKIDRIAAIYKNEKEVPSELFGVLEEQRQRLLNAKEKFGSRISPFKFS